MPSDPTAAFQAHSNYLRAFAVLISSNYVPGKNPLFRHTKEVLEGVAQTVQASPTFLRLQSQPSGLDHAALRSALRNAWGTELLLASTAQFGDNELIAAANNWAVVQAYYACFHSVQALAVARGQVRPKTHAKLQQQYTSFWVTRTVTLPPWSLGWQSNSCRNLPPNHSIRPIHDWKTCDEDSCWDLVALALRTTRKDRLDERIREARVNRQRENRKTWEKDEEQRRSAGRPPRKKRRFPLPLISEPDKAKLDSALRPTTILDYLYRLRIRSNYEDSTMFTDGPATASDSMQVHRDLCSITAATLLVHELHIRKLTGRAHLETLVDEWLDSSGASGRNVGLRIRRDLVLT